MQTKTVLVDYDLIINEIENKEPETETETITETETETENEPEIIPIPKKSNINPLIWGLVALVVVALIFVLKNLKKNE